MQPRGLLRQELVMAGFVDALVKQAVLVVVTIAVARLHLGLAG